jgi:hypothetical protein
MSILRSVFAAALAVAPVGLLAGCESTAVAVS